MKGVVTLENQADSSLRDIVKFLQESGILKRTQRTGWVDVGVFEPESVADHSYRTAVLCMLYGDLKNLDVLKMLRMALIHDLAEAIIGDLMPSQKSLQTKKEEEDAICELLGLLPERLGKDYLKVWTEYLQGKTQEAKAARQIDKIEMALQAKEYEKLGHESQSLERFVNSAKQFTYSHDLKRLLNCILEEK